ncbi:hypothetical protein V8F44DRAFT_377745 [Aspergillus fumigatus]
MIHAARGGALLQRYRIAAGAYIDGGEIDIRITLYRQFISVADLTNWWITGGLTFTGMALGKFRGHRLFLRG